MARDSRYESALRILAGLKLPIDAPSEEVDRAVFHAYPWGERRYHPYKVWLLAVKRWRADRDRLRTFSDCAPGAR